MVPTMFPVEGESYRVLYPEAKFQTGCGDEEIRPHWLRGLSSTGVEFILGSCCGGRWVQLISELYLPVNSEGFWEGLVTVCLPLSLTHGEGSRNWLWALGTQMVSWVKKPLALTSTIFWT